MSESTFTIWYRIYMDGRWQLRTFRSASNWQRLDNAIIDARDVLKQQQYPTSQAFIVDDRGAIRWVSDRVPLVEELYA